MADGPENTTVNGREVSYVDMRVRAHIAGEGDNAEGPTIDMPDLKEISWQASVTLGKAGGPGGAYTRRTTGRTAYTAGCVLYRSGRLQLIYELGKVAEQRGLIGDDGEILWGRVEVTIGITFSYLDEDAVQTVELVRTRFIDEAETATEGEAAQECTMAMDIIKKFDVIGGKRYAIN